MLCVNLTFYQLFWTSINSLYLCVKADISMTTLLFSKTNLSNKLFTSAIVCRKRHFLDKRPLINRYVFVSIISRSSFRRPLQKQLKINVINVFKKSKYTISSIVLMI